MNPTPTEPLTRNDRRTLEGTVTSDQCAKTITVEVERTFRHKKYKKYVRKVARFHAHDEKDEAKKGDRVEIRSCRPLSRTKRWLLVRIINRAAEVASLENVAGVGDAGALAAAQAKAQAAEAEAKGDKATGGKGGSS
jgi:small subunit ribosomal protein S17